VSLTQAKLCLLAIHNHFSGSNSSLSAIPKTTNPPKCNCKHHRRAALLPAETGKIIRQTSPDNRTDNGLKQKEAPAGAVPSSTMPPSPAATGQPVLSTKRSRRSGLKRKSANQNLNANDNVQRKHSRQEHRQQAIPHASRSSGEQANAKPPTRVPRDGPERQRTAPTTSR
jgi:hypothetical protein